VWKYRCARVDFVWVGTSFRLSANAHSAALPNRELITNEKRHAHHRIDAGGNLFFSINEDRVLCQGLFWRAEAAARHWTMRG